jgi:hypothetical protein
MHQNLGKRNTLLDIILAKLPATTSFEPKQQQKHKTEYYAELKRKKSNIKQTS